MNWSLKHLVFVSLVLGSSVLTSCKGDKSSEEEVTDASQTTSGSISDQQISAQNVFNTIPARAEITRLIGENQIEYNPDLLHTHEFASKYSLENSRAMNLGVYGADLSVAGAFDQTQESMLYLSCVNILAKNLGVSTAFDQRMMDRMEAYKENRDSTLEIIAQSFKKADEYLKENNRPGTSSMILSGAWIEGMYVSCQVANNIKSENIVKTILGQEESLGHLINLLNASHLGEDAKYVSESLVKLKASFEAANQKKSTSLENIKDINDQIIVLRKKVVETF